MNTNLVAANNRLLEINQKLQELIPQIEKAESDYYSKYRELFLSSQQRTEAGREAEAREILRNEYTELAERYGSLKIDVRCLLTEKEILIECCRNYRSMQNAL